MRRGFFLASSHTKCGSPCRSLNLYDALLEDLEDDGTPSPDEAVELADKEEVVEEDDELQDDLLWSRRGP